MQKKNIGLSLNPKKYHFSMQEEKLLGHFVLVEGVKVDPSRVKGIQHFRIPKNKKEVQSLLGKNIIFKKVYLEFYRNCEADYEYVEEGL